MSPAPASASRAELFRALGALAEEPGPEHRGLAEALGLPGGPEPGAFTDLFALNLYPYASVHLGAEGMLGGEARNRVAGFWNALGIRPPAEPDHLGALLGLLAELSERGDEEPDPAARLLLRRARTALVREHLLPWLPPFLGRVVELGDPFYASWAALLLQALEDEAAAAQDGEAEPGHGRPLPLHLRAAPGLPDPRGPAQASGGPEDLDVEDRGRGEDFLKALLAPIRSGMIVTRADLARAGRELELGVRMGERLYILKALLGQDPAATLAWLAQEARAWTDRHQATTAFDPDVAAFWTKRAAATARLLDELAAVDVDPNSGGTDHA